MRGKKKPDVADGEEGEDADEEVSVAGSKKSFKDHNSNDTKSRDGSVNAGADDNENNVANSPFASVGASIFRAVLDGNLDCFSTVLHYVHYVYI